MANALRFPNELRLIQLSFASTESCPGAGEFRSDQCDRAWCGSGSALAHRRTRVAGYGRGADNHASDGATAAGYFIYGAPDACATAGESRGEPGAIVSRASPAANSEAIGNANTRY